MAAWHRRWQANVGLRLIGMGTAAVSYLAVVRLMRLYAIPTHVTPGAIAYALACVAFLTGSAGAALICCGNHLFDEIPVGQRWRHSSTADFWNQVPNDRVKPDHING